MDSSSKASNLVLFLILDLEKVLKGKETLGYAHGLHFQVYLGPQASRPKLYNVGGCTEAPRDKEPWIPGHLSLQASDILL